MTVEVLVCNVTETWERDGIEVGRERGDIFDAKEQPCVWGAREGLPWFVRVIVSNATIEEARSYLQPWMLELDFSVVAYNDVLRGVRMRVQAVVTSTTLYEFGDGSITRDKIETALTKWAATIFSTAPNELIYDVDLDAALVCVGMWGARAAQLSVEVNGYVDRVYDATYTYPIEWPATEVVARIEELGGTILELPSVGTVRVSMPVSAMRAEMERDFRRWASRYFFRRHRHKLTVAACDQAVSAGGVITVNRNQFALEVIDKVA